ncbi:MAG: hypothetical protein U9N35_08375 [Euryarchaeota archaeon]|nr:hypothetical protein [Euryarchaeota archaeon]
MRDKKTQFFIFTAILVISSVLLINYTIISYKETSTLASTVSYSDVPYISRSINKSFQKTLDNTIPVSVRDGELENVMEHINEAYFGSYAIGENELNFGIASLNTNASMMRIDNIDQNQNFVTLGPNISILGLKTIEKTQIYENTMDIGIKKAFYEDYNEASREFTIEDQVVHIGENFISGERFMLKGKEYEITEVRKVIAENGEGMLSFEDTYTVDFYSDHLNIETIGSKSPGALFDLEDHHCVLQNIHYTDDDVENDYAYIVLINRVESVSEKEVRTEIFAPSLMKGLNYGNIRLNVKKKNFVPHDKLTVGDTVVTTVCIHNDYTYAIDDSDIDNSTGLGFRMQLYRILRVSLIGGSGEFHIETNLVNVLIDQDANSEWYLRVDHNGDGDIDTEDGDDIQYYEGDSFYLRGYSFLVHDIIGTGTQSVTFYLQSEDKHVEVLEGGTEIGTLWLGSNPYDVKNYNNTDGSIKVDDITYYQGDSFVRNGYLCVLKDIGPNEVQFITKNMPTEHDAATPYRFFRGWKIQDKWSYNFFWKYVYNNVNGTVELRVEDDVGNSMMDATSPLSLTENSAGRTVQGALMGITDLTLNDHDEIDLYCFKDRDAMGDEEYYLGGLPVAFEFYKASTAGEYSQRRVAILIDADLNGQYDNDKILHGPDDTITFSLNTVEETTGTFREGRTFFLNGVGYQIKGIFICHDDGDDVREDSNANGETEEWRVVVNRVPAYQFAPLLKRMGKEVIAPFTFLMTNWEFKPQIAGRYIMEIAYTYQETKRVTESFYLEVAE